jgi:hypothetical protein
VVFYFKNAELSLKIKLKELDNSFKTNEELNNKINHLESKIESINNLKINVDRQCDKLLEKIINYEKKM